MAFNSSSDGANSAIRMSDRTSTGFSFDRVPPQLRASAASSNNNAPSLLQPCNVNVRSSRASANINYVLHSSDEGSEGNLCSHGRSGTATDNDDDGVADSVSSSEERAAFKPTERPLTAPHSPASPSSPKRKALSPKLAPPPPPQAPPEPQPQPREAVANPLTHEEIKSRTTTPSSNNNNTTNATTPTKHHSSPNKTAKSVTATGSFSTAADHSPKKSRSSISGNGSGSDATGDAPPGEDFYYPTCTCCRAGRAFCGEAWCCSLCLLAKGWRYATQEDFAYMPAYCLAMTAMTVATLPVPVVPVVSACMTRRALRDRYGIAGSTGGDCCKSVFCFFCTVQQMAGELHVRGTGIPFLSGGPTQIEMK